MVRSENRLSCIPPTIGHMDEPVLMGDARIRAIPVVDVGEELVDLRLCAAITVDDREADQDGAYAHLRGPVVKRLEHAQTTLPDGLTFLVIEGYRPPAVQRHRFERYRTDLAERYPAASKLELAMLASRYISPPEIAPHSSGAAVDLTLQTREGIELHMGTRLNASPEESDGRCYTNARGLSSVARGNRQVLVEAPEGAGLVNYPTEWWHWSYGDRYWAFVTGAPQAIYGTV